MKSDNPLLAEIQDLIKDRFDLETWASPTPNFIDVHIFGRSTLIFYIGIVGDNIFVCKGIDTAWAWEDAISLYDDKFLDKLWEQIEDMLSMIKIND